MFRLIRGLAALVLIPATVSATAADLPETIRYTFYREGTPAGHTTIRTSRASNGRIVFESTTEIRLPDMTMQTKSRTEADPDTWTTRRFTWSGVAAGTPYAGDIRYDGSAYSGYMAQKNQRVEQSRAAEADRVFFFENYVATHEILLARARMAAGDDANEWEALFPSSYSQHKATISVASDVLVESRTREIVCRKLVIKFAGSPPFASYYDEAAGLPVYIVFPDSGTEIFLDSFYGDDPISRFVPNESGNER